MRWLSNSINSWMSDIKPVCAGGLAILTLPCLILNLFVLVASRINSYMSHIKPICVGSLAIVTISCLFYIRPVCADCLALLTHGVSVTK